MAQSMTGFARVAAVIGGETATIEISSVNHRYLECTFRLPGQWMTVETALRDIVKAQVARGKVHVSVRYGRGAGVVPPVTLDKERAAQYIDFARELMHMMRSTESLSLNTLIALDGVMRPADEETDLEEVQCLLGKALQEALSQLNEMRAAEGRRLIEAIEERLAVLEELTARVEARIPELAAAYEQRLRKRLADIQAEVNVKEDRLAMELAMMVDRMDVTEELVRLRAHIAHSRDIIAADGPVGRDLNFLVQELQREVNTLGAKLRDVETCRDNIEMKAEVEKIREQLQNLE